MKFWVYLLAFVFAISVNDSFAQKRKKKSNGYSAASMTKKKYNKQWLKLRQSDLPRVSVSFGGVAGRNDVSTDESNVTLRPGSNILAPGIGIHVNPLKNFGFTFGLGYRNTQFDYSTDGNFANDSISAVARGNWYQKMGNAGLSFGLTYYGGIAKKIMSCSGYGLVQSSRVHFFVDAGAILAPSIFNEVYFNGNYRKRIFNDVVEEVDTENFTLMFGPEPRRSAQTWAYAKAGFRISNGNFATRIGVMSEYQLNTNTGLVNDFTNKTTSFMTYGLYLAFEIY